MFCDNGKVCYPTVKEASVEVANLNKHDKKHKYNFYKCPICKTFHTSTIKKANDNYSPPYSTTEPASPMKGGNSDMYKRLGLGYIKTCCQEAIHIFETISMTFDK